jgi:UDP-glucose 4-epimerase
MLDCLDRHAGVATYNLGTGGGHSVLEMVRAFEAASGQTIPYRIMRRRPGDIAACYASVRRAEAELGWRAKRTIAQMCADTWRWQSNAATLALQDERET